MAEKERSAAAPGRFPEEVAFKGSFRPSQKRVIEATEEKLRNRRAQIVAAPGSGKSFIGLELIRRMNCTTLILSPSTTAAEQWRERFEYGFMPEGEDVKEWVGRDTSSKAPIISLTYQALHASGNAKKPVSKWVRAAGVQLLCLDDPHHLRVEWWKTLEELRSVIPGLKILTLFGSAPADSTDTEKGRIFKLCGGCDAEISAAELLREGSLCPYQDFIQLCPPTGETAEKIEAWQSSEQYFIEYLAHDPGFASILETNLGLENLTNFSDAFRERPEYFMALLSCLKQNQLPLPEPMPSLLGDTIEIPPLSESAVRQLLLGYLDFDQKAYAGTESYREVLVEKLKEEGLYGKTGPNLSHAEEIAKLLESGIDKYETILEVIQTEQATLGDQLRMMIVADPIKKEVSTSIGNLEKPLRDIGTVPIFEYLRRAALPGIRMIVLSSTFLAVPSDTVPILEKLCKFTTRELKNTEYVQLQFTSAVLKEGIQLMLELFEEGIVNVLVTAPSSVTEDFDCPAINSLVLATPASNAGQLAQLRGCAMRKDPERANKTVSIWHLISTDAHGVSAEKETFLKQAEQTIGVSLVKPELSLGRERFVEILQPLSPEELTSLNQSMRERSADRHGLWKQWNTAVRDIPVLSDIVDMVEYEQALFPKTREQVETDRTLVLSVLGIAAVIVEFFVTGYLKSLIGIWISAIIYAFIVAGLGLLFYQRIQGRMSRFRPKQRLLRMAQIVLESLQDAGKIVDDTVEILHEELSDTHMRFYLSGGSAEERAIFADTLAEAFGPVTNHRCVIEERLQDGSISYYPVPALFDEDVDENNDFYRNMDLYYGGVIMGFTPGRLGRELMLKSRFYSMRNPLGKKVSRTRFIRRRESAE